MKEQGYTMLELVAVLALLGIIGCTVIFGTRLQDERAFKSTVRAVEESLIYVRQAAVKTGRQYNVFCLPDAVVVRTRTVPLDRKSVV